MNRSGKANNGQAAEPIWNAGHMLDVHILDYLKKRNLVETAAAFKKECQISEKPRAVDTTSGFLFEWWSIFWEIYVARTNPSYSQYAHTYAQAQKAKHPHWHQQQIQQLEAQQAQQQLLQQQMMIDKNLSADPAVRSAEQVNQNRLRAQWPGAAKQAAQDQMSAKLQQRSGSLHHFPFQTNGGSPVEAVSRGVGGLASPPLESRASTGGTDNGQHRHSIVAAMQAAQRANSQGRLGSEPGLERLLAGQTAGPASSPWPNLGAPSLAQRDNQGVTLSSLNLPENLPPELRQQAMQQLYHQQLLQQQQALQGQGRGLSADVSLGAWGSRQSSASMQRFPQSPTIAQSQQQQQQQQQQEQQRLSTAQQLQMQQMLQQNMQARTADWGVSRGPGQGQGQGSLDPTEAQHHMLAQLKAGMKQGPNHLKPEGAFVPSNGAPGQDPAANLHPSQREQLLATLRLHQEQQQLRLGPQHAARMPDQMQASAGLGRPNMQGPVQNNSQPEDRLHRSDSQHNGNSPASSTVGASALNQNSRAPTPPPSSSQEVGRVTRGKSKPALAAVANKKRKLGNHSSNSESQGTPPDSNFSKGSGSNKGPARPSSMNMSLGQMGLINSDWYSTHMNKMKPALGSSMNAAAAALDDCPDALQFSDLMTDDLDQHLMLNGDTDVHDPAFLGVEGLGMEHLKGSRLSHSKVDNSIDHV